MTAAAPRRAVLLLLLGLAGCDVGQPGGFCDTFIPCSQRSVCYANRCSGGGRTTTPTDRPSEPCLCLTSSDCRPGSVCVDCTCLSVDSGLVDGPPTAAPTLSAIEATGTLQCANPDNTDCRAAELRLSGELFADCMVALYAVVDDTRYDCVVTGASDNLLLVTLPFVPPGSYLLEVVSPAGVSQTPIELLDVAPWVAGDLVVVVVP